MSHQRGAARGVVLGPPRRQGRRHNATADRPLGHVLLDWADTRPHDLAIVEDAARETTTATFAEVARWSFRMALRVARVAPARSRVAYLGSPSIDSLTFAFGCALAGVVLVAPNPTTGDGDVDALLDLAEPALTVVGSSGSHATKPACVLPQHRRVARWALPATRPPLPSVSTHDPFLADVVHGARGWHIRRHLSHADVLAEAAASADPMAPATSILRGVQRLVLGRTVMLVGR